MEIRLTTEKTIPVLEGQSILDMLKSSGIYLVASCSWKGTHKKPKMNVVDRDAGKGTSGKFGREEREMGLVLACQSYPQTGVLLEISVSSQLAVEKRLPLPAPRNSSFYSTYSTSSGYPCHLFSAQCQITAPDRKTESWWD